MKIPKGWVFSVREAGTVRQGTGRWVVVVEETYILPGKCKVVVSRSGERYGYTHTFYDFTSGADTSVDEAATIAYHLFPELL